MSSFAMGLGCGTFLVSIELSLAVAIFSRLLSIIVRALHDVGSVFVESSTASLSCCQWYSGVSWSKSSCGCTWIFECCIQGSVHCRLGHGSASPRHEKLHQSTSWGCQVHVIGTCLDWRQPASLSRQELRPSSHPSHAEPCQPARGAVTCASECTTRGGWCTGAPGQLALSPLAGAASQATKSLPPLAAGSPLAGLLLCSGSQQLNTLLEAGHKPPGLCTRS